MKHLTLVLVAGAVVGAQVGVAQTQSALDILRAGCADDSQKLCAGVQSGGGRIIACLKQHKDELSPKCKQAAAQASGQSATANPNSPPASAPTASSASSSARAADALIAGPTSSSRAPTVTAAAAAKSPPAAPTAPVVSTTAKDAPGSYLLMKKVTLIDPGMANVASNIPAFDLLIPSTWKFVGNVVFGGGKGGCFADLFAVVMTATSADGSTIFQTAPDYTWQYADDPAVMKSLNDPTKRALGVGGKPCPVAKPMRAEDYFRQNVATLFPSSSTVVSIEAFPELNEIVRKRQGLPPGDGNTGSTRTEAIRARIAYQKDGKDLEEWVGLAIVVNISRLGGGSFYDSHATALVALTAPKGKLDANDKLFKVIVSSITPQSQWVTYSNNTLTKLYQAQAQKEAVIDSLWAAVQRQAIADIQGVTANMMHGSNVSAMQADQNIRQVQTFRDPSTGKTMELSNLYDHAWLNGQNQYVMSDDPSFNPNSELSGSWDRLQVVTPSP